MRPGLNIGAQSDLIWRVGAEHAVHLGYPPIELFPGPDYARIDTNVSAAVFSTPSMILLMERAARKAIEPFLEPGESSVGASVQIDHLAPTPLGAEVRAVATVLAVDGRTVDFDVVAHDRHEIIGRGKHRRAVIKLERLAKRIEDKTKLGLGPVAGIPGDQPDPNRPTHPVSMNRSEPPLPTTPDHPATDGRLPLPATPTLKVTLDGPVAHVLLDRPLKRNAVNRQMTEDWERLNAFFANHPELRVVIVTGAGDDFCAGDDIPEVGTLSLTEAQELSYRQARFYLAWEQLPQIFIAAVAGRALGGGCVAASACDFRIATHEARFGMPEILLGWPPGYGIAQLTALIGKPRAMEMCVTGEQISAQQALQWGLVHRLVPHRELPAAAKRLADQLCKLPATALAETKRLVHADEGLQPKTAFYADTAAYVKCLELPDARRGIDQFKSKQLPAQQTRRPAW
jgi:enoyl-CoA hydratase